LTININNSIDKFMGTSTNQYFDSFALEFTEYMRELQSQVQLVHKDSKLSPGHIKDAKPLSYDPSIEYKVGVDRFILRNVYVSIPHDFNHIINNFLNKHLQYIRSLQLEGLNMGYTGALLLHDSQLVQSKLIEELRVGNNGLGDRGALTILESLQSSSGVLEDLVLMNNDIALANEGLRVLASFTSIT
jgi:hypothetical protein